MFWLSPAVFTVSDLPLAKLIRKLQNDELYIQPVFRFPPPGRAETSANSVRGPSMGLFTVKGENTNES